MSNIIVISDIHLGSPASRVKVLAKLLKNENYGHLIINGDLFDNKHIHRYKKRHWNILSLIRKISKRKKVTLVKGNHDITANNIIKILGLDFVDDYKIEVNGKRILFMHLHQFDSFMKRYVTLSIIAEKIYYIIQTLDRSKKFSRWLKKTSKIFLNVKSKIRGRALEYISDKPFDAIIGGHIHFAEVYHDPSGKQYANSGSFCDDPCHYLIIDTKGNIILKEM
jgi:UDP-2,3-diacylglucosamine pyrophosphatase LpxH